MAIGDGEALLRCRGDEVRGERSRHPACHGEDTDDPDPRCQPQRAAHPPRCGGGGTHRSAPGATTVKLPPSLRPYTAGLYISSACAGGRTKVPGVVARAT